MLVAVLGSSVAVWQCGWWREPAQVINICHFVLRWGFPLCLLKHCLPASHPLWVPRDFFPRLRTIIECPQGEIQSNPLAKAARISLKRTALPTFEWTIKHFRGEFHLDLRSKLATSFRKTRCHVRCSTERNGNTPVWRRDLYENSTINNRSRWYTP